MKYILFGVTIFSFLLRAPCQPRYADSLKSVFESGKDDSSRVFALYRLGYYFTYIYPDSAILYADTLIKYSKTKDYPSAAALGFILKSEALDRFANYPAALDAALKALELSKALTDHRSLLMGMTYYSIAHLYHITGDIKNAIGYSHVAGELLQKAGGHTEIFYANVFQLAAIMSSNNKPDSARYYLQLGAQHFDEVKTLRNAAPWLRAGNIYEYSLQNIDSAEFYFREGLKMSHDFNNVFLDAPLYEGLAAVYRHKHKLDSAIFYARRTLQIATAYNYPLFEIHAYNILADIFDGVNNDSALMYLKLLVNRSDKLFGSVRSQQFQQVAFDAQKREREVEDAQIHYRNQIKNYLFTAGLSFLAILAIVFWRHSRQKQRANNILATTLSNLKSAQQQLIQSEKMASLGELSAGIAHEIQNPLNFVNNFSETNAELLDELAEANKAGNLVEAEQLINDLKGNEQKILEHGKRADSIVKNMLQHSHSSNSQKQPTDINALADEYLRLSYHGMRARDKDFSALIETHFDERIGQLNVVPQDIGRVLLNLFNNAFYAVEEKKKHGDGIFEPSLSVSTKREGDKVCIAVKDNGTGMSEKTKEKIFQPFFTTKPTGQGTGLGLSLSYDIITKGHGGQLLVETAEGKGSTFILTLPAENLEEHQSQTSA